MRTCLRNASFEGSDINKADFSETDLRGVNFIGVKNWETAKFEGAIYDRGTQFPCGFDPEAASMCLVSDSPLATVPDSVSIDIPSDVAEADVVYDVPDSTLKLANIKMYPQRRYGRDAWFFFAGTLVATVVWGIVTYFAF